MWQLVINGPGYFDTPFNLPQGVTSLGRAEDNDIVLSGDLVSRRHARLHRIGEGVRVEDLGSRNGSRLNGEPFTGTVDVRPGDTLTIGENALALRMGIPEEEVVAGELEQLGFDGKLLVSRSIRESQVLRALGNVPRQLGSTRAPSPVEPQEPQAEGIAYDTLLMLYQVAESLPRALSLADFMVATCDTLVSHVGADTAAVLLRQADGSLSVELARHGGSAAEAQVSRPIVEDALRSDSALVIQSTVSDGPGTELRDETVICVPMGAQPAVGALYLKGPFGVDAPIERLADAATATAHLLAAAVQRFERSPEANLPPPASTLADRLGDPAFVTPVLASLRASGTGRQVVTRQLSTLAVDLGGALEGLGDGPAGEVLHALHVYFFRTVRQHGGLIEGSDGERLRAVFPQHEGDAVGEAIRAVRCALELRGAWDEITLERPPAERCPLRAVVVSGEARLGELGPVDRPELVVLGTTGRLADLLLEEGAPGQVLLDGKTLGGVGVAFEVQPLGERQLGTARTAVFEVLEEDFTDPGRAR